MHIQILKHYFKYIFIYMSYKVKFYFYVALGYKSKVTIKEYFKKINLDGTSLILLKQHGKSI